MTGWNIIPSTGVILRSVFHCRGQMDECHRLSAVRHCLTTCRKECLVSVLGQSRAHLDTSIYCSLRASVSSLMEAWTVNNLRELCKRVHRVHRFLCLGSTLSWLVKNVESRVQGLIQGADPGEELGQSWEVSVSTLQPLSVVSQTEQDSVSVRDIDVVSVRQDLLFECAVISVVGVLEEMGDNCI